MPKQYEAKDKYFQKARQLGYRARSVFKLEAIQKRFHILKPGDKVLDLGAAPGSFLQYISKVIGKMGLAVGIDLKPINPFRESNVKTCTGDIFDEGLYKKIVQETGVGQFDVITSDLAPSTSGIRFLDAGRSLELNLQVLAIADVHLKPGGHVVMKIMPGVDEGKLILRTKNLFKELKRFSPPAVRKTSREFYIVGINKRNDDIG